jgi:myosin heavy subunit
MFVCFVCILFLCSSRLTEQYAYLSNGDLRISERDDKRDLKEIMEAFKQLGIAEDEVRRWCMRVTASLFILYFIHSFWRGLS